MRYFTRIIPALLCLFCNGIYAQTQNAPTTDAQPPYQGSAERMWEIIHTRVALSFDRKEKTAAVREWINLHPYNAPTDIVELDAKSLRIDSIAAVGKTGTKTPLNFSYIHDKLTIWFDHKLSPDQSAQIYLKYTAMPYAAETGGSAAIKDDRGLYFINADGKIQHKPTEIWTQGEIESNSHWMATIDKPNTRFTTQIELTVPDSCTTLSNGALIKQTRGSKGMRTDIWKMDMPIQAYAVMFAIGKYSIIRDKWKNKEVSYYVEPEFAPYARQMFSNTPEMIDFFSTCTGIPYPWNKYSQVVARDYVSGAMENTSASLFGEFMNQTAREIADKNSEDVVSHELFHQWFGDYVTCESWSNITVNESFANYGEQLWREHKYGKVYRDELAWDDLQKYIYATRLKDPQLVRFHYDNREEVFDAISYNKGGAILHYINAIAGDAAFNRAMKTYLSKNALHSAEAHNWRMAVEEATGQDWNWFFNQWYYHAGHPVLKVNYDYNDSTGKLGVSVTQIQEDSTVMYTLPLKTAVIYGAEKTIIDWNITQRKDTFTFAYKNGVRPVIIPDDQHVLPGEIRENKKMAQWLAQYRYSDNYVGKRLAVVAACKQPSDSNAQAIIDLALRDDLKSIRHTVLIQLQSIASDKYRKKWTNKIIEIAAADKERMVRADAFALISEWKVAAAKPTILTAVADSSYAVAGSALDALGKLDNDTAYVIARKLVGTHPCSYLKMAIWTLIAQKGADGDMDLLEQYAPYEQGNKKIAFAFYINSYLKHVKSDAAYNRGIYLLAQLTTIEDMKSHRTALAGMLAQAAGEQKGNLKSDDKEESATAQRRYDRVKTAMQKVIAAEQDPAAIEQYKKIMKDTFDVE